tara:strand:+ start:493 stop:1131 length:639 start_codon:yes stop_codon:yes gene_type:complete
MKSIFEIPLIKATEQNLKGYGNLIDKFENCEIKITKWPKQGWRQIDPGTGDEGGTTEGLFHVWWDKNILYGKNDAVPHKNINDYEKDDIYLLAYSFNPDEKNKKYDFAEIDNIYQWHANYHPDGGQLFFPQSKKPFICALALPGDDIKPENFKAFYFDGSMGLYIHPYVWHDAAFPLNNSATFKGKQGKVHARVSVDFTKEFNCYLKFKTKL